MGWGRSYEAFILTVFPHTISVLSLFVQYRAKDMNALKGLKEVGIFKAHVLKIYSFAEMDKAHLELE